MDWNMSQDRQSNITFFTKDKKDKFMNVLVESNKF